VDVDEELARLLDAVSAQKGFDNSNADDRVNAWLFEKLNVGGVQKIGAKALAGVAARVLLRDTTELANRGNIAFLGGPPGVGKTWLVMKLASCLGFKRLNPSGLKLPGECDGYHYHNFSTKQGTTFNRDKQAELRTQLENAQRWAAKSKHRLSVMVFDEIHSALTRGTSKQRKEFQEKILRPILDNEAGFLANKVLFVFLGNVLVEELADEFGEDSDEQRATKVGQLQLDNWGRRCLEKLGLLIEVDSRMLSPVVCPPPTLETIQARLADKLVSMIRAVSKRGGEYEPWGGFSRSDIDHKLLDAHALWGYKATTGLRKLFDDCLDAGVGEQLVNNGRTAAAKTGSALHPKLGLDNGQITLSAGSRDGPRVELAREGEFDSSWWRGASLFLLSTFVLCA
jgi:hypothetical protein